MEMDNNPVDTTVTDDLDAFSSEFFGQNEAEPEPAGSEATEAPAEEVDAPTDEPTGEEDTPAPEEEAEAPDEEEEAEEKPAPKKKNSLQERINEVVGKQREAERKLTDALAELERLKQNAPIPEAPKAAATATSTGEPAPSDTNADGTDKYPLGEFDPGYIKDLARFSFNEEKRVEAVRVEQAKASEAQAELQRNWDSQVVAAEQRYEDFHEVGENLQAAFAGIEPGYGEYLAATLMAMDNGVDVLYYLSTNLDVAKAIVASTPTKATLMLGKLEAQFAEEMVEEEAPKPKSTPRVSKAPLPPPTARGSSVSKAEVPADTDDLESFSKAFFR